MSAAVLRFPMSADAAVMQRGRRAKLPVGVKSLQAYRIDRQRKQDELTAANIADTKDLCYEVLTRAMRGQVKGLVVLEAYGDEGSCQAFVAGEFSKNSAYLQRVIDAYAEVTSRPPEKARP